MLYFLNIFKIFGLIYFANYYLKKKYPQEYNKYLLETSLRIIYIGSVIQIKLKKITTYVYNTFPRIKQFLDNYNKIDVQDNIEYILDGKVIYLTSKEKIVNHIINITKEDFIIYSDYANATNENACINKKIIIIPEQICSDKDFIYEISDIKFMLCELYIGDKVYKINLKSDIENYNYYLVDNIIDKKFIIYYLIEFYNEDFYTSTDKFILKLIDHNVNICELDITDTSNYIQIKKDSYIIN